MVEIGSGVSPTSYGIKNPELGCTPATHYAHEHRERDSLINNLHLGALYLLLRRIATRTKYLFVLLYLLGGIAYTFDDLHFLDML